MPTFYVFELSYHFKLTLYNDMSTTSYNQITGANWPICINFKRLSVNFKIIYRLYIAIIIKKVNNLIKELFKSVLLLKNVGIAAPKGYRTDRFYENFKGQPIKILGRTAVRSRRPLQLDKCPKSNIELIVRIS